MGKDHPARLRAAAAEYEQARDAHREADRVREREAASAATEGGMSTREIAGHLRCSHTIVARLLDRARKGASATPDP
jgi:transposase